MLLADRSVVQVTQYEQAASVFTGIVCTLRVAEKKTKKKNNLFMFYLRFNAKHPSKRGHRCAASHYLRVITATVVVLAVVSCSGRERALSGAFKRSFTELI